MRKSAARVVDPFAASRVARIGCFSIPAKLAPRARRAGFEVTQIAGPATIKVPLRRS